MTLRVIRLLSQRLIYTAPELSNTIMLITRIQSDDGWRLLQYDAGIICKWYARNSDKETWVFLSADGEDRPIKIYSEIILNIYELFIMVMIVLTIIMVIILMIKFSWCLIAILSV